LVLNQTDLGLNLQATALQDFLQDQTALFFLLQLSLEGRSDILSPVAVAPEIDPEGLYSYNEFSFDFEGKSPDAPKLTLFMGEEQLSESRRFSLPRSMKIGNYYLLAVQLSEITLNNFQAENQFTLNFSLTMTSPSIRVRCGTDASTKDFGLSFLTTNASSKDARAALGEIVPELDSSEISRLRLALIDQAIQFIQSTDNR
jgi:hypothetical protein